MLQKNQTLIEEIMTDQPFISYMVSDVEVRIMLHGLFDIIEKDIEGDIVELGCNQGTSALFLQRVLTKCNSTKTLHLYDSFEGLPKKTSFDVSIVSSNDKKCFQKGSVCVTQEIIEQNFQHYNVAIPLIHKGWFKDIPDEQYPQKVAFAFFDGDFYTSILDSFERIYPRLTQGAYVFIHDYQWNELPGVELACNDFLKGKPEYGKIIKNKGLGCMRKL